MKKEIIYSSMKMDDLKGKLKVNGLMNNTDAVVDHLDKTIHLKHIIIEELKDDNTTMHRTILIDDENKSYGTTSRAIMYDIERIRDTYGEPSSWEFPIPVKIVTDKKNKHTFYKIIIDVDSLE